MKSIISGVFKLVLILLLVGIFYKYYPEISKLFISQKPCAGTIYYSLGTFDNRFGITQTDFITDLKKAETVWEKASGKNLFEYSDTGTLKINFIYDNRQKVTDELKKQGINIDNYKATYDNLKSRYDFVTASLKTQRAVFEADSQLFASKQASYSKQVSYWNSRGGAPKKEFAALTQEKEDIAILADKLNNEQDVINSLVADINGLVSLLNNVAQKLNANVVTFNTIGAANGEEFSEGEYIRDTAGTRINIYQFESQNKLIRVLEHEFGHAIGLPHVLEQDSIMYRLNNSNNISLTAADTLELNRICEQ